MTKIEGEVKAAIIIGSITILLAALTQINYSKIEIVDVYPSIININNSDNMYIDIMIKNVGDEVAVINKLDIEVLKASINYTPVLSCKRLINASNNSMSLSVRNQGWGPALNATIVDFYNNSDAASKLGIDKDDLMWNTTIQSGQILEHSYKLGNTIKNRSLIGIDPFNQEGRSLLPKNYYGYKNIRVNPEVKITYSDVGGQIISKILGDPNSIINIYFINNTTIYEFTIYSCVYISSTQIYKGLILNPNELDPNRKDTYKQSLRITQSLMPNTSDRFLVKVGSTSSAKYDLKIVLYYDVGKSSEFIINDVDIIV
jgi:hypothetical protein